MIGAAELKLYGVHDIDMTTSGEVSRTGRMPDDWRRRRYHSTPRPLFVAPAPSLERDNSAAINGDA